MREITFRGKRVDNGEWVYGYYFEDDLRLPYIMVNHDHKLEVSEYYEVWRETVGQYAEKRDTKGKKVFEGDIVTTGDAELLKVEYWGDDWAVFVLARNDGSFYGYLGDYDVEIVGNAFSEVESGTNLTVAGWDEA